MDVVLTVIELILRGIIAISGMAIAYILIAFYFPRILMKPVCVSKAIGDRGIKKYIYEDGRCVVYEPEIAARKFVKQYMLFTKDGAKYIKCLLCDKVRYVVFDVLVFNNKNQLIDVVNVEEQLKTGNVTRAVQLSADTSYVSLVLRKADNMYENKDAKVKFSHICGIVYAVLSALSIAVSGTLLNSFLRAVFKDTDIVFSSGASAFVKFLMLGAILGGLILLLYKTKYRRRIN